MDPNDVTVAMTRVGAMARMTVYHLTYGNFYLKVWESFTGNKSTSNHTTAGNHCQTSVLQFLHLHLLLLIGSFWIQIQWIETKVTGCAVEFVHVGECGERHGFHKGNPSKDLNHRLR